MAVNPFNCNLPDLANSRLADLEMTVRGETYNLMQIGKTIGTIPRPSHSYTIRHAANPASEKGIGEFFTCRAESSISEPGIGSWSLAVCLTPGQPAFVFEARDPELPVDAQAVADFLNTAEIPPKALKAVITESSLLKLVRWHQYHWVPICVYFCADAVDETPDSGATAGFDKHGQTCWLIAKPGQARLNPAVIAETQASIDQIVTICQSFGKGLSKDLQTIAFRFGYFLDADGLPQRISSHTLDGFAFETAGRSFTFVRDPLSSLLSPGHQMAWKVEDENEEPIAEIAISKNRDLVFKAQGQTDEEDPYFELVRDAMLKAVEQSGRPPAKAAMRKLRIDPDDLPVLDIDDVVVGIPNSMFAWTQHETCWVLSDGPSKIATYDPAKDSVTTLAPLPLEEFDSLKEKVLFLKAQIETA